MDKVISSGARKFESLPGVCKEHQKGLYPYVHYQEVLKEE